MPASLGPSVGMPFWCTIYLILRFSTAKFNRQGPSGYGWLACDREIVMLSRIISQKDISFNNRYFVDTRSGSDGTCVVSDNPAG